MPNNMCRNVVLLFRENPFTGCQEFIAAFTSLKSAKLYRRIHFGDEVVKAGGTFNEMFPIERHAVKFQEELYK